METGGITFLGGVAWPQGVMRRVIHCFSTWFSTGIYRKKMPRKRLSISFSMLVSERGTRHDRMPLCVQSCPVPRSIVPPPAFDKKNRDRDNKATMSAFKAQRHKKRARPVQFFLHLQNPPHRIAWNISISDISLSKSCPVLLFILSLQLLKTSTHPATPKTTYPFFEGMPCVIVFPANGKIAKLFFQYYLVTNTKILQTLHI